MDDTAWLEVRRVMAYLRHEEFIGGSLPNSPPGVDELKALANRLKAHGRDFDSHGGQREADLASLLEMLADALEIIATMLSFASDDGGDGSPGIPSEDNVVELKRVANMTTAPAAAGSSRREI